MPTKGMHRIGSMFAIAFVLASVLGLFPVGARAEWSAPRTVWVEESGHTVNGLFLDEWRARQWVLGLPVSEEVIVKTALGRETAKDRTIQYFENMAIVWVPGATDPAWEVQGFPIGAQALKADEKSLTSYNLPKSGNCDDLGRDTCTLFTETGHTIRHGFKQYWEDNDGERLFGKPLTEEIVLKDGYTIQYFENVVLRWKNGELVTLKPIGTQVARLNKVSTAKVAQPADVSAYSESLFVEPVAESVGGQGSAEYGPGPQQGTYKEIVVSISASAMWAYEDGQLVISSLVSTGVGDVPETVTPIGYFSILSKLDSQTMEGTISGEYYRVEDVPYVMYFDNLGNALHGTYWHNNFGYPMSHGCVNLPMDVAAFIYGWAPVGTAVTVIG